MIFERSNNAMTLADDERRFTDANAAACHLLRAERAQLLGRRIDDYWAPETRDLLPGLWESFLAEGSRFGLFELWFPPDERVTVEYSATANVFPGRHLAIFLGQVPLQDAASESSARARQPLTSREREVLELVALGAGTEEMAARLVVSEETVRTHVKNVMQKLGAHSRAQAVALAFRYGELAL